MKITVKNARTRNEADQLMKTPSRKRGTYTYRFHKTETVNGRTHGITEEIEIIPGEDGVTEEDIKALYAAEDSEVYYNIKAPASRGLAEGPDRKVQAGICRQVHRETWLRSE